MYYDAAQAGHAAGTGFNCLSVATTTTLTPSSPVFTDDSTQPLLCEPGLGGSSTPAPSWTRRPDRPSSCGSPMTAGRPSPPTCGPNS